MFLSKEIVFETVNGSANVAYTGAAAAGMDTSTRNSANYMVNIVLAVWGFWRGASVSDLLKTWRVLLSEQSARVTVTFTFSGTKQWVEFQNVKIPHVCAKLRFLQILQSLENY